MSIFYPDPPAQTQTKKEDVTWGQVVAVIAAVLGFGIYLKWPRFEGWYFNHYEQIYFGVYLLVAAIAAGIAWQIANHTKELAIRGRLLFAFVNPRQGILVGVTTDGVRLWLPDYIRTGHVQILGSTGRGKTESVIIPWMGRDLLAGRNVILIDGKGDPEIVERVRAVAVKKSIQPEVLVFDLGNPSRSCSTNPLAHGSAQQITDRIFTAFEFDDSYYKAVQYDVCSAVISLMLSKGTEEAAEPVTVTFERLYGCLTSEVTLSELIASRPNHPTEKKLTEYLNLSKEVREQRLSGLLSQLAPFAVGEVAPLVNGKKDKTPCATVSEILLPESDRQKIFLILLPTLKYQQLGHQLGKLLMQELGWAVGERACRVGKNAPFTPVYLDEFSAFVYPGFTNILNKARSSQVPFHLSHQSLGDLEMVSPEFAQIITTNSNVKCILGLNDPESADFMARHMGTRTQEKLTEQAEKKGFFDPKKKTGAMSIREVESYKIHPNDLKCYVNGRGVIHFPSADGSITEEIQFERLSLEDFTKGESANG